MEAMSPLGTRERGDNQLIFNPSAPPCFLLKRAL